MKFRLKYCLALNLLTASFAANSTAYDFLGKQIISGSGVSQWNDSSVWSPTGVPNSTSDTVTIPWENHVQTFNTSIALNSFEPTIRGLAFQGVYVSIGTGTLTMGGGHPILQPIQILVLLLHQILHLKLMLI